MNKLLQMSPGFARNKHRDRSPDSKRGSFPQPKAQAVEEVCGISVCVCVCQSLYRSVSRSAAVSQSVGRAVALAASRSVGWPLGRSVGRLRSVGRSIGRWSVDRCQAGSRALGRLVCHSRGGPEGVCRFLFSDSSCKAYLQLARLVCILAKRTLRLQNHFAGLLIHLLRYDTAPLRPRSVATSTA